ncbi:MAG: S41 family peptidase [Pyrinomonadaceae bacterium]
MAYRSKFVVAIISAAIAFYAISGVLFGWTGANAQQPINDPGAQIRIFESVLQHIQNDYVDEPDLSKVRNGALRGLADGLDPYSSYLTADQVADYRNGGNEKKVGIGADFSQVSSYLYVVSVVKGSPAYESGIRAGDIIEYVESKATRDISLYDAYQLVLGAPGTKVKLRVPKQNGQVLNIEVERKAVSMPAPAVEVNDGIAKISLSGVEKGTAEKLRVILGDLNSKGVKKAIIDLRNVSVGSIEEAVEVANLFVGEGKLAHIIGRENKQLKAFAATGDKKVFDGKVSVLIDSTTAGPAEVIAAAISENKRGDAVGTNTFGAGVVQGLFTLSGGDGYLLTTAKWAGPNAQPFLTFEREKRGVKPTVEVKRPSANPEEDEDEDAADGQETPEKAPVEGPDLTLQKAIELMKAAQ